MQVGKAQCQLPTDCSQRLSQWAASQGPWSLWRHGGKLFHLARFWSPALVFGSQMSYSYGPVKLQPWIRDQHQLEEREYNLMATALLGSSDEILLQLTSFSLNTFILTKAKLAHISLFFSSLQPLPCPVTIPLSSSNLLLLQFVSSFSLNIIITYVYKCIII